MHLIPLPSAVGSLQIASRRRPGLLPRGKAAEAFDSSALPDGSAVHKTGVISRNAWPKTHGLQDAANQ